MTMQQMNIGSVANDGNGETLRSGGAKINANFAEVETRLTSGAGAAANAQQTADAANVAAGAAQTTANAAIPATQKGAANGVATLDGSGQVPASQLPSYVDDVIEVANFAALPATGETGKIYVTDDTNLQYRWSGSGYIQLVASPGSSDAVPEGSTNLYFSQNRVRATLLTGLAAFTNVVIAAGDTVLASLAKLQGQISALILRAVPLAAATDATTDFNTLIAEGWQPNLYGGAPGSRNANHPDGQTASKGQVNYYWVQNEKYASNLLQIAYPYESGIDDSSKIKFRHLAGGTWGAWRAISTDNCAMLSGWDLNNITVPGKYFADTTCTNLPIAGSGYLDVSQVTVSSVNLIEQVWRDAYGISIYRRYNNGTWAAWRKITISTDVGALPLTNRMVDSGRFAGRIDPNTLQTTSSWAANSQWLVPYGTGSGAFNGGKFNNDNSTNGGLSAAIDANMQALLAKMGRTGSAARYGAEFYQTTIAGPTANPGVSGVGTDGVTRYLSNINLSRAIAGANNGWMTFAGWVTVASGSVHMGPANGSVFHNGVQVPVGTPITAAMGPTHVRVVMSSGIGYDAAFPYMMSTLSATYLLALPVFLNGVVDTGVHISPVPGINEALDGGTSANRFVSAQQTITAAGTLTIAHGLGAEPAAVECFLKCITASEGYAVGDTVAVNGAAGDAATNSGVSVIIDATNLYIKYGSVAGVFLLTQKATGAVIYTTIANWRLIVKASL